jgi:hypothetical protein
MNPDRKFANNSPTVKFQGVKHISRMHAFEMEI